MKKFMAILLAGVLCTSMAACGSSNTSDSADDATEAVVATEAATTEMDRAGDELTADDLEMEEVTYDESAYEGEWTSFGGGFDLYIPTDWTEVERTDETPENVTYLVQNEEGSLALAISVADTGLGEEATIQELAERISESGTVAVDRYYNVNGFYCVGVTDANGNCGYCFLGIDGIAYTILAGPIVDEDSQALVGALLNSLSYTEE